MLRNKAKAAAIFDIHGLKSGSAGGKILTLLDILIAELREANDTVTPDNLLKNQGEIEGYLQLKDYIERGIPTPQIKIAWQGCGLMKELPQNIIKTSQKDDKQGLDNNVTLPKEEVIDILKTLEGLKRKLQPLLKT